MPIDLAKTEVPVSHVQDDGPARVIVTVQRGSATDPAGQEGRAWLAMQSAANHNDVVWVTRQTASLQHTCVDRLDVCSARVANTLAGEGFDGRLSASLAEAHQTLQSPGSRDPRWVALEALRALIYEGHPFGHPPEGRDGALDTIKAHHVRRFFGEQVVRSTVHVQATGTWTTEGLAQLGRDLEDISTSMPADPTMMAPVPLRRSELYLISTTAAPAALAAGRAWRDQPQTHDLTNALAEQGLVERAALTTDAVHGSTIATTTAPDASALIDTAVALFSNPDVGPVQVVIVSRDAPALLKAFEDRATGIVQAEQLPSIVRVQNTQDLFR